MHWEYHQVLARNIDLVRTTPGFDLHHLFFRRHWAIYKEKRWQTNYTKYSNCFLRWEVADINITRHSFTCSATLWQLMNSLAFYATYLWPSTPTFIRTSSVTMYRFSISISNSGTLGAMSYRIFSTTPSTSELVHYTSTRKHKANQREVVATLIFSQYEKCCCCLYGREVDLGSGCWAWCLE